MGYTDVDKLAINTIRVLAVSCILTSRAPPPLSPRLLGRDERQREQIHQDFLLTV